MFKEMNVMMDNEIIEMVLRKNMVDYYQSIGDIVIEAKCQNLMLMLSFNHKRHPNGSLNRHKARLCCYGG